MIPVVDRGNSRLQGLGECKPGRAIEVDRPVIGRQPALDGEIVAARPIADQAAHEAIPQVPMRVDESRQQHHAVAGNHFGALGRNIVANGDDLAITDVHVGARLVAERRVHGHHIRAANDDVAACGQPAGGPVAVPQPLRHQGDQPFGACMPLRSIKSRLARVTTTTGTCTIGCAGFCPLMS